MLIFLNGISENKDKLTYYYEKFYKYVFTICFDILYNKQETDFVVNSVFYKVYKSIERISSDDNAKAWIGAIARNEAVNYNKHMYSQSSRTTELDNEALYDTYNSADTPLESVVISESVRQIYDEIENLKPEQAEAMLLKFKYGFTTEEIAKLLNTPVKTIYGRIERGTKQLKIRLEEKEGEGSNV